MITPNELRAKAEKLFAKLVIAHLRNEDKFPVAIPSNKQLSGSNYSDWKGDLVPLYEQSKAVIGKGYSVDWGNKKVNGSVQSLPKKIYFETFEDYLFFTKRGRDYEKIIAAKKLLVLSYSGLENWANSNPVILLENDSKWPELIRVCDYFTNNAPPHDRYLRELPISVHSKFIEQNSGIIKKLLDILLPSNWVNQEDKSFEGRYLIKSANVYTNIRILDDDLKSYLGYEECSLTLEDASWLTWVPERVFIIENRVCFLTFPRIKNAVAIFGEGFKSRLSKHIRWLAKTEIYCWFDLDCAGFEMLNMLREHYQDARSFLMDMKTLETFHIYCVENRAYKRNLDRLTSEERLVYNYLFENQKRLEQERISQSFVMENLR